MTDSPRITLPVADFSNSEFVTVGPFPHVTQMTVMPVVAYRDSEIIPLGTCFALSNDGLVMTARHVIDRALWITGWSIDSPPQLAGWWIGALYAAEPGPDDDVPDKLGGLLPANKVHLSTSLDVGVMHLNLPVNHAGKPLRMPSLEISPGLPKVDEYCFSLGYHGMQCEIATDGKHTHHLMQSYSASRGRIKSVHFRYRDRGFLSFPCFETTSRFDPGMSGAPIFNERFGVIGVVCSSFGQTLDGFLSYGSMIGPALTLQVDSRTADGGSQKSFLYDFVAGGAVLSDDTMGEVSISRGTDSLEMDFGKPPVLKVALSATEH